MAHNNTCPICTVTAYICPACEGYVSKAELREREAAVWEAAAKMCQHGSDEPMTGDDEQIRFGQAGVKLALGVLAIAFRARAAEASTA
jgi:hypothetical protein